MVRMTQTGAYEPLLGDAKLYTDGCDRSTEFGNYIGADLDSDDDGSEPEIAQASTSVPDQGGNAGQGQAPLEGYDDEEDAEMMDLDPTNGVMALQTMDGVGTSQSCFSPWSSPGTPSSSRWCMAICLRLSKSDRLARGQEVLSHGRGDLWTGRRDPGAGGGCSAAFGTDRSAYQSAKVCRAGEGDAGHAV